MIGVAGVVPTIVFDPERLIVYVLEDIVTVFVNVPETRSTILPPKDALPETVSDYKVPTVSTEEFTTPDPRVVESNNRTLFITIFFPAGSFKFSEKDKYLSIAVPS